MRDFALSFRKLQNNGGRAFCFAAGRNQKQLLPQHSGNIAHRNRDFAILWQRTFDGRTFSQIAAEVNLSPERIRRICWRYRVKRGTFPHGDMPPESPSARNHSLE
jgi:hypothetical protein